MFAPLPLAAKEHKLIPVSVAGGDVVIKVGEPGDRFYIVGAGELEVVAEGVSASAEAGDHFGEIALLRGVTRTATVRAVADSKLYALRDDFLAAVTGHPCARPARQSSKRASGASRRFAREEGRPLDGQCDRKAEALQGALVRVLLQERRLVVAARDDDQLVGWEVAEHVFDRLHRVGVADRGLDSCCLGLPRPPSPRLAARPALARRPPRSRATGAARARRPARRLAPRPLPRLSGGRTSARIVSSSTGAVATTSSLRLIGLPYQARGTANRSPERRAKGSMPPAPKRRSVRRALSLACLFAFVALAATAGPAAGALPSSGFLVFKDTCAERSSSRSATTRPAAWSRSSSTSPPLGLDGPCGDPHFRAFARWKKSPKYYVNAASIPSYLDATLARAELVRAQEAWKRFTTDCRFRLRSGFNAKDRGDTSLDPTTVTQLEIDRVNVVGWVSLEGTVATARWPAWSPTSTRAESSKPTSASSAT